MERKSVVVVVATVVTVILEVASSFDASFVLLVFILSAWVGVGALLFSV
jgi:hypothetical protein